MNKRNKHNRRNDDTMMQKLHHVERELAKVAPPKVENEEFTVITTLSAVPDQNTVAGVPQISRLAVTGNGWYVYAAGSSSPIQPANNIA
jgi:hypothetical protein